MVRVVDVVVDRVVQALDRPFTYWVPEELADQVDLGYRVRVPLGRDVVWGIIVAQSNREETTGLKPVLAVPDAFPVLTPKLIPLAHWLSERYLCYLPQAIRAMVPKSVRSGQSQGVRGRTVWYRTVKPREGRASQKQSLYLWLAAHQPVSRQAVLAAFPQAGPLLRQLIREGVVAEGSAPPAGVPGSAPYSLTADQQHVVDTIWAGRDRPWLLQGVTGSGKTEVYLHLLSRMIGQGRQGLVLLPEISLTPQTVARFRDRFGSRVGVWHSGLSDGERRDTWHAVREGRMTVIVGARSAVFLPFPDLGLVVLDEEHEPSYKQEEHPRYHTREVALWRGRHEGALVVLGTATPALETLHQAHQGELGWTTLPRRVAGWRLPTVEVVDMRQELRENHRHIFSRSLLAAIDQTLARQEQVVLFLNRRGYSTFVLCRSCGQAVECPDCAVTMTYHQDSEKLVCHYCQRQQPVPTRCPECGSDKIRYFGAGTERVQAEVEHRWPGVRVLRADRDVLHTRDQYDRLYQAFLQGEADVLVGTQMIAKGLDFPRVSLVGIVAADSALNLPDFRSAERTFQLLVQAAGRAGRSERGGRVIIQTYNPEHYALTFAAQQNMEGFYQAEVLLREELGYPPFTELWLLEWVGPSEAVVQYAARIAVEWLRERLKAPVLGPAPAPIARLRGQYRYHALIKSPNGEDVTELLRELPRPDPVSLTVTRDPYFMM